MSLTIASVRPTFIPGNLYATVNTVTLDNSYEANGELLTLQELGFGKEAVYSHSDCSVENKSEQATYIPNTASYDGAKLHVFDAATGKELASTKDLSKVKVTVECFCTAN